MQNIPEMQKLQKPLKKVPKIKKFTNIKKNAVNLKKYLKCKKIIKNLMFIKEPIKYVPCKSINEVLGYIIILYNFL